MSDPRFADNLGYICREAALAHGEDLAIVDLHGGRERRRGYRELYDRMDRVAAMLRQRGLEPGDRVALSIGNRVEFVEAMFGAMRAGLVPVPLNTQQGPDVLAYILENAEVKAAIVEPAANRAMQPVANEARLATTIAVDEADAWWEDYDVALMGAPDRFEPEPLAEDHMAFLAYTSGSTGRPKGVPLSHRGQLWWIRCFVGYWPAERGARNLLAVPLYHKNAMAGGVKPRLATGGSFVILPGFEPRQYLRAAADYKITVLSGVPTVFTLLLQQRDLIESLDLSSVQVLVVGSAPVHEELERQMAEAFGCPVLQSYGLTEGGPVMLGPPLDGSPVPRGSCGLAWPEGEVKLVDGEGNDADAYGELWVKNPGVPDGYYRLPEVSAERYTDGWLHTGDLFRRDADGFYFFQGRTDDMFNCGGENIYPKEVENLLLSHDEVIDACVVPIEHAAKGQAPVALVVLKNGGAADEAALQAYCLENGPPYAHPRRIAIADELPLTGAKKVDRKGIARDLAERFGVIGG